MKFDIKLLIRYYIRRNAAEGVMNLAMYVRDMVDSTRPYGRVFGPQPSAN